MSDNGQLLPSELTKVQEGALPIFLAKPAAAQWFKLKASYDAAHADKLTVAAPVGGYRSYATQQDMWVRPWLYGLSAYSTVPLARPGYSTHGDGLAVDIADASTDSPRKRWLLANAEKFGFTRQFGDADPNHYRLTSTAGIGIPIIEEKEDTMFVRIDKGNWAYRDDGVWVTGITQTPADVLTKALGHTAEDVTGAEFARLQALLPDRVAGTVTTTGPTAADIATELVKLIPAPLTSAAVEAAALEAVKKLGLTVS